ncbi:hypothetical protein SpCBS45565_g04794 [Spizellomyces sp. 'palustris']|nr:hypothetical protein SpCBS45565_g04794 [Spizellomyces sp. 'palustris']
MPSKVLLSKPHLPVETILAVLSYISLADHLPFLIASRRLRAAALSSLVERLSKPSMSLDKLPRFNILFPTGNWGAILYTEFWCLPVGCPSQYGYSEDGVNEVLTTPVWSSHKRKWRLVADRKRPTIIRLHKDTGCESRLLTFWNGVSPHPATYPQNAPSCGGFLTMLPSHSSQIIGFSRVVTTSPGQNNFHRVKCARFSAVSGGRHTLTSDDGSIEIVLHVEPSPQEPGNQLLMFVTEVYVTSGVLLSSTPDLNINARINEKRTAQENLFTDAGHALLPDITKTPYDKSAIQMDHVGWHPSKMESSTWWAHV